MRRIRIGLAGLGRVEFVHAASLATVKQEKR